jgi:hypothetical protein
VFPVRFELSPICRLDFDAFRGRAMARLVACLSTRRRGFDSRPFLVRFMVDKVALCQVFLRVLWFFPGIIASRTLQTLLHVHVAFTRRTNGRCLGTFQKAHALTEVGERWVDKYYHTLSSSLPWPEWRAGTVWEHPHSSKHLCPPGPPCGMFSMLMCGDITFSSIPAAHRTSQEPPCGQTGDAVPLYRSLASVQAAAATLLSIPWASRQLQTRCQCDGMELVNARTGGSEHPAASVMWWQRKQVLPKRRYVRRRASSEGVWLTVCPPHPPVHGVQYSHHGDFEKLTVARLVSRDSAFYGIQMFVALLTIFRYYSQCKPSYPVSINSILIVSPSTSMS